MDENLPRKSSTLEVLTQGVMLSIPVALATSLYPQVGDVFLGFLYGADLVKEAHLQGSPILETLYFTVTQATLFPFGIAARGVHEYNKRKKIAQTQTYEEIFS